MAQSGSRPPKNTGNRAPRSQRATAAGGTGDGDGDAEQPATSANDRARARLAQQPSGGKPKGAAQKARSSSSSSGAKGASSRNNAARPKGRSTAATVGIFGGVFVILAVLVILLVSITSSTTTSASAQVYYPTRPASSSITTPILNVSPANFDAAGSGAPNVSSQAINALKGQPLLKSGNKPLLVYFGAEYCPYCAATRWPLAIALSRFGTLTNLDQTKSSHYDAYPDTNTLSFWQAKFSSPYLALSTTEEVTNKCAVDIQNGVCPDENYTPLQAPSALVSALLKKYDASPYVPASSAGGIPFIYYAGKYVQSGALYNPQLLAGSSWQDIAAQTQNPTSTIGQTVLGSANLITAAICTMTGGKPGSVCKSAGVVKAAATLPK